jgi:hypothetical protein
MHRLFVYAVLLAALAVPNARGGTIDCTGAFFADDNVQLFNYTVQNQGLVTIATTSFSSGGFSPILSLFDSTGQFLFDDSGYSSQTDALTEYDNFPNAANDDGNLSEGFQEDGNGNFTANPPFTPSPQPGAFYDGPGGLQLTGNWAVNFSAPDAAGLASSEVQAAPEPASFGLALTGAALLLVRKRLPRRN